MFARRSYNVAPDIIDAGQGGGSGNIVNNSLPLGVVVPFAGIVGFSGGFGVPEKWELCDGRQLRQDTYQDLYNTIGYTYGTAPATTTFAVSGGYATPSTTNITFTEITTPNVFITAGTYLKLSGFTAITGQDINGVIVLVASCPAIGSTGSYLCTIPVPLSTTGNGSAGILNRFSIATPNLVSRFPLGASTTTAPNNASTGGASTITISADNLPQHRHGYNLAAGTGYASADGGNGNRAAQVQNYTNAGQTYLDSSNTATTNSAVNILNPYLALNYIIHAKL